MLDNAVEGGLKIAVTEQLLAGDVVMAADAGRACLIETRTDPRPESSAGRNRWKEPGSGLR